MNRCPTSGFLTKEAVCPGCGRDTVPEHDENSPLRNRHEVFEELRDMLGAKDVVGVLEFSLMVKTARGVRGIAWKTGGGTTFHHPLDIDTPR
jgi:hypothetical protein